MEAYNDDLSVTWLDKELVALAKGNDASAFAALTERYMPLLRSRAARYSSVVGVDLEDFVQEGLLALFKAVKGFDPDVGIRFKTYAVTCINNSMISAIKAHLRGCPPNTGISINSIGEEELHQKSPVREFSTLIEDLYIEEEDSALRALQIQTLLSGFERQVLKLYLGGYSYKRVSQILSTTTKAVDNALQRIRRKLRPEL